MLSYATYENLRKLGAESDARQLIKEASSPEGKNVFLSHTSKDDDLLPGVIRVLEGHGGRVYVDQRDPALPDLDIFEIANRLREAVRRCQKFVVLVTPRSKDSKWIPWELGLGDGVNNDINVALFPSAETALEQKWSEQEYLGLYQRIFWGDWKGEDKKCWMVLDHRNKAGTKLSTWLRT
jgi:hypothetical protein